MIFDIDSQNPRYIFSFVATHGLTDLRCASRIVPYVLLFVPIYDSLVTFLFFAASLAHFSYDMGIFMSILLHFLLFCMYKSDQSQLAFDSMLLYMFLVVLFLAGKWSRSSLYTGKY